MKKETVEKQAKEKNIKTKVIEKNAERNRRA